MESVLRQLAGRKTDSGADFIKNKDVVGIIGDPSFWRSLPLLCDILEPASQVVMAIQSDTAMLADVPRYWAHMARVLEAKLASQLSNPGAWGS